ncbi:MAG: hypothetical protein HRU12_15445, partial [Phaeodactylibacter sp.]|nr:hypothetical protein [Phaeodactylibacter sp.]
HAIERRRIYLEAPPHLERHIRQSASKLEAIGAIAEAEYGFMKTDLRLLVLTDYIRADALPASELDLSAPQKMGVAPIFEVLRQTFPVEVEIGVLTGSLLILPNRVLPLLEKGLAGLGLTKKDLFATELPHDSSYVRLQPQEQVRKQMISLITKLYNNGQLQVLIGTNALLGEGWDAPAANTLILATVVKSFVSSNQARGRVIRMDPRQPDKAANIWHLACMDPYHQDGGLDWQKLAQRFRAFTGPSFDAEPGIENGVGRFRLPSLPVSKADVGSSNQVMLEHARARGRLMREWDQGIEKGVHMAEEITLPVLRTKRQKQVYDAYWARNQAMVRPQLDELVEMGYFMMPLAAAGSVALVLSGTITSEALLFTSILGFLLYGTLGLGKKGYAMRLFKLVKEFEAEHQLRIRWFRVGLAAVLTALVAGLFGGWITGLAVVFAGTSIMGVSLSLLQGAKLAKSQQQLEEASDGGLLIERTGKAILLTLRQLEQLSSAYSRIRLCMVQDNTDRPGCYLENVTLQEEQLFLSLMEEALGPIENPRYLIVRKHFDKDQLLGIQYYAVPGPFGQRRADADAYLGSLQRQLPEALELRYTRTFEGRRVLLQARSKTLT